MVIALILFSIFRQFDGTRGISREVSYSQFMEEARQGAIKSAVVVSFCFLVTLMTELDFWMQLFSWENLPAVCGAVSSFSLTSLTCEQTPMLPSAGP